MRKLVLMRGAPGCGKSTWIRNVGWEEYTISSDVIRLLVQSPVMDHEAGQLTISQQNDRVVWDLLFDMLEKRMERGEFCVVDACHSKAQDFAKYKKLIEKYRYRLYCIDFSHVPLELCKKQNKMRPKYKFVPELAIENIYARFRNQEVPGYCKVINHTDLETVNSTFTEFAPVDVNKYENVVVIGDVHGCFNPLEKWFLAHPFSDRTLYIFVGDYIDRGIENDKVIEWLLQNYYKENVILLEGNHEKWLQEYARGDYDEELAAGIIDKCKSKEFFFNTSKQLEKFNKKDLRNLCRKFIALSYFTFRDKKYLVSHSGVGFVPDNLVAISAETFVRNNDYRSNVDEQFERHLKDDNIIQIHGHRNPFNVAIDRYPHSINLCDDIEHGGNLRIIEIKG